MASITIVSNRLPISVKKVGGKLKFYPSAGGLATGLASYTEDNKNKWVGWPGIVSDDLSEAEMLEISEELKAKNCYPVFLTKKQIDEYYNGYSNSILWPFFHNMPISINDQDKFWNAYKQINQLFAETVMGLSDPESTVWVHDYQLLLVPEILRQEHPYSLVGFFLHIPFPNAQTFKELPHGKILLKGILGSDLVGFHTDSYVQEFLDTCQNLHIGTSRLGEIVIEDRAVKVTAFPLGIDYTKFSKAGTSDIVKKYIKTQRKKYGRRRKIILTVDRLDPTKGLVERLLAYQEFLTTNKRMHKKVTMVMLAIPSRTDIPAYRKLKKDVEKLVDDINTTFGNWRWQPVHYMYKTVPFDELAALYRMADVAFIAPIKDGMNLVAKEYIASQQDMRGILVLSETAGAARELTDALLVNPSLPNTMVEGLSRALNMKPKEFKQRAKFMRRKLATNTIHHWKRSFMKSLDTSYFGMQEKTRYLENGILEKLLRDFSVSKNPTLLLDYDGVLVPFVDDPKKAKLSTEIFKILDKLSSKVRGGILVVSGRSRNDLDMWLGKLPLFLGAEHGAMFREAKSKDWERITKVLPNWKEFIKPILQKYADKTPGAFVEEKECSLVWHYRNASPYYAQKNRTILLRALKPQLKVLSLNMYQGNMILEVKSPYANKGALARRWVGNSHDFILAFGDDYTDEDTFAALPESAYTVKVGRGKTLARYRVNNTADVQNILVKLSKVV